MNQQDINALIGAAIFLLVILCFLSFLIGCITADYHWRKWCIRKDIAQYHPKHGDWELLSKYKESK